MKRCSFFFFPHLPGCYSGLPYQAHSYTTAVTTLLRPVVDSALLHLPSCYPFLTHSSLFETGAYVCFKHLSCAIWYNHGAIRKGKPLLRTRSFARYVAYNYKLYSRSIQMNHPTHVYTWADVTSDGV